MPTQVLPVTEWPPYPTGAYPVELSKPDELVVVDEPTTFGQLRFDERFKEPELEDKQVDIAGIAKRTPMMT